MNPPFKFRASSISKIMTEPRAKTEVLSVGAKTYLAKLAKEFVYGYEETVTSKFLEKGIQVEPESLELYNSVHFTDYKKNAERKTNDWVTGECDIFAGEKIIDLKSSWSLATFPATSTDGEDTDYEWQGRVYMWLWDVDHFEVAYCLVNTPDELIGYEDPDLHYVDHINPVLRVTTVRYKRDKALEDRIKFKVEEARRFINLVVQQIADEHAG
jgi:hypothetical protein